MKIFALGLATAACLAGSALPARAQTVEEFYSNNDLRIMIGYSPGGGYDTYARLLARYIGKYIPGNPNVVTENLPGAGSVTLANQVFNVLPSDGTVIGATSRAIPVEPLLGNTPTQYDAREFTWIGSMTDEASVCVASAASGISDWDSVVNGDQSIIMGGTGAASDNEAFLRMQQRLFDANIQIISGYAGSAEVNLAMEQGEVDGYCGSWSSFVATRGDQIDNGEIIVLVVLSTVPAEGLEGYPLVTQFAENQDEIAVLNLVLSRLDIARPFLAAPGVPEDRAAALRGAFMQAINDPELIAEAEAQGLELNPMDGATVNELIEVMYDTPQSVLDATSEILAVQ